MLSIKLYYQIFHFVCTIRSHKIENQNVNFPKMAEKKYNVNCFLVKFMCAQPTCHQYTNFKTKRKKCMISNLISAAADSPAKNPVFTEKDNAFRQFRRLCADIAEEASYTGKTALVSKYLKKGHSGGELERNSLF